MSAIADASLRRLTEEQRAIAELAFAIGAKYADRRFDDHDASLAQWEELAASGLTGLSLPEEHGGGGGMLELCIACERLAAGGFPAAKLIISTAMAGTMIARHGTPEQQERWLPGIAVGTQPVLLRLHRARGRLEREQPPAPRPRRRPAGSRSPARRPTSRRSSRARR